MVSSHFSVYYFSDLSTFFFTDNLSQAEGEISDMKKYLAELMTEKEKIIEDKKKLKMMKNIDKKKAHMQKEIQKLEAKLNKKKSYK